ncbi:hypothetical protein [Streptomyces globisporus]
MAGPLLRPAGEPWPVCTVAHPKGTGHLLSDVRLRRRIQDGARGRDFTEDQQRRLDAMKAADHVRTFATTTPCRCRPSRSCPRGRSRIWWGRRARICSRSYMGDLSIAPGWKVGGFASWHLTDPAPVDCQVCGTAMRRHSDM